MEDSLEENGKIVRVTLESLVIKVTNDEMLYRNKYLPDPRRLSDNKIVCTVCSLSLANRVRKGKKIYIHTILGVLVCKDCYSFYGDGIFSTDEDGDDKYCRWCGQGGTLYLCSACNCGFCKKCMMKNMKTSALAAIERDDWKCLICIPRPIFGSRAVCWASRELNNVARKKNLLHQRLEEEKSRLEREKKIEDDKGESLNAHVKRSSKTMKRVLDSDDSDSSTVSIPAKKRKENTKSNKSLNGSVKKHRRKDEDSSSGHDSSYNGHRKKLEKRKIKSRPEHNSESSNSDESSRTSKKKKKLKKKLKRNSDDSSDSDNFVPKSKTSNDKKFLKRKRKKKRLRSSEDTSDSTSNDSVLKTSNKNNKKVKVRSFSESYEEDQEKFGNEEREDIQGSNCSLEVDTDNKDNFNVKTELISSLHGESIRPTSINDHENGNLSGKENQCIEQSEVGNDSKKLTNEKSITSISNAVDESEPLLPSSQPLVEDLLEQVPPLNDEDFTLSYQESPSCSDDKIELSQEDEVQVKVHLAIEWLDTVASDIADLGSLIAQRTNKFGERKVNLENLHSYEDVLTVLDKLKQLLGGIHTNYRQIEDNLEDKLKSWKILAGLEKSDLEDQLFEADIEEEVGGEVGNEDGVPPEADFAVGNNNNLSDKLQVEPLENVNELPQEDNDSAVDTAIDTESNHKENYVKNNENEDIVCEQAQNVSEDKPEESGLNSIPGDETLVEESDDGNEATQTVIPENKIVMNEKIKEEFNFKSGSSDFIWPGLFSSDEDSNLNNDVSPRLSCNRDDEKLISDDDNQAEELDKVEEEISDSINKTQDGTDTQPMGDEISQNKERETSKKDADIDEALQELLYSSTEPEVDSSGSDSDSSDLQLDDSDLDEILKPKKVVKKSNKHKDVKDKEESRPIKNIEVKVEIQDEDKKEEKLSTEMETEKKEEEPLDSEAEIDMLTDLSKLKKKTIFKKVEEEDSSEDSSSEGSEEDDGNGNLSEKKKRKKYNTVIKKKREKERNELFGFLQGDSSAEDEVDITKDDLDGMEGKYASESSDSMTLEAFSRKMTQKWQELEKEQDQLNLQILLASESEPGSDGGDDLELDSDGDKNKKEKKIKGKIKEEKKEEMLDVKEEDNVTEVKVKEEKDEEKEMENVAEPDQEYKQFLEDISKKRTTFTGLGSSSEGDKDEIEIKDEPISDIEMKVKKEPGDSDKQRSSDSDNSSDLFLDITKKKSDKKAFWRQHRLLRMKLSDTDTSDEERWWQRRLEREKKKKEENGDSDSSLFDEFAQTRSPKKSQSLEKKSVDGSDKENKKIKKGKKKEEEDNSSSTLEMSSTESSGSDIFKRKKKKKKESSDSDVVVISDSDKKKKKKKKKANHSGDSSDESEGSDDDVIDITQKSSQGESPGKGGRKNIRKVLTKHELAAATKAAAKEEEERKKRIAARQKVFNEMFEIKEAEVLEKLVLDFDPETKTELISVDKGLVTKMKPHQAKGVKFMWDSCFESLSQMKTKKGSGCILAHCMGLGKTFQVVSLVHTILTHKDTNVGTVLVVCPLSTVLNWYNEFDKWLEDVPGGRNIKIYHLTKYKKALERARQLARWHETGGVMIIGYELFRILADPNSKKFHLRHTEVFQKTLIDPGADLVVCDEGHMLKNESTLLSKAMSRIRTLRRIVLTGTPMQNNLKEYHCMVQFVKPNLLGTRKEFLNQFVNPINNGQFVDSTEADVKVMKRRAHVLHKMLEGLVQRFDYSVLTPFLPPKHEYVISLRLSDVQVKLYQFYLDYFCQKSEEKRTSSQLFTDWQNLGRIWTHPRVLKWSTDKAEKERQESSSDTEAERKKLRSQKSIKEFFKAPDRSSSPDSSKQESEDEESIKDFINDKSSSSSSSLSSSSDNENGEKKEKTKKKKVKGDDNVQKKEVSIPDGTVVEPVDEINLISSEEEDGGQKDIEEVKEDGKANVDSESGNKADDSGIEDQEGKTGDTTNDEEKMAETSTEDNNEKEKIEEENENKEEEKDSSEKEKKIEQLKDKKEESGKEKKIEQLDKKGNWWKNIVEPHHLEDINQSAKLVLLFAILRECEMIEDKVLVFSQSLFSLDLIEYFLKKVDQATEENRLDESLGNHAGCWQKGLDYFRLDGSTNSESRSAWCKSFNKENNPRARLFLISTRAGGLGINLTGANRVVIFDASWNPSHDIQSIFRIYRFGQKKPCYVYRFVAHGTMEEKVYDRQVAKQLLSSRVVDEQQVQRHFSMSDLNELYTFTPPQDRTDKPIPVLPKDRLMAELVTQYNDWIEKYHEHDSLLENIADEELNEEERKAAWEDYENEKKRGFMTPTVGSGATNFPGVANQMELFRKSLKLKFPNATDAEMNAMLQTLMYQVNYRTVNQQLGIQPQLQTTGQQRAGTSQQQIFRSVNSNSSGSSSAFAQMVQAMNQTYQKPFTTQTQNATANQMNTQRVSTNQVKQQMRSVVVDRPMNRQMIGNGQIRKTNRTSQEIYMEQMRKQQEANLLRIQNQKRIQQLAVNSRFQQSQNNPGQSTQSRPSITRVSDRGMPRNAGMKIQMPQTPQPAMQNRFQSGQNSWKPNQPIPNRTQQAQKQRENAASILGRRQGTVQPVAGSTQSKQSLQNQMQQRMKQFQQRQSVQDRGKQQTKPAGTIDPEQQRRLDEMKKRYNATRMKQNRRVSNSPISIVEIDDEPGT